MQRKSDDFSVFKIANLVERQVQVTKIDHHLLRILCHRCERAAHVGMFLGGHDIAAWGLSSVGDFVQIQLEPQSYATLIPLGWCTSSFVVGPLLCFPHLTGSLAIATANAAFGILLTSTPSGTCVLTSAVYALPFASCKILC